MPPRKPTKEQAAEVTAQWETLHKQKAAHLLSRKWEYIEAMIAQAEDPKTGRITPQSIAEVTPKRQREIRETFEWVERTAFPKISKKEIHHTHSLEEQFKQLQQSKDEPKQLIEGDVVE